MMYTFADEKFTLTPPPGVSILAVVKELSKSRSIAECYIQESKVIVVMKPKSSATPKVIFNSTLERIKRWYRPDGILWKESELTKTEYYNLHPEFAPEKPWWYCRGDGFKKFYLRAYDYQDAKILARNQVGDAIGLELGRDKLRHNNPYEDEGPPQPQSANDYH